MKSGSKPNRSKNNGRMLASKMPASRILVVVYIAIHLAAAADNLVVPGVRCGVFVLGKTTEREIAAAPKTEGP